MSRSAEVDLTRILSELAKTAAYNHPVSNLKVLQTHTSCVFLTGKYAYKIKKPVNFEFLDYSTLELRHRLCDKEVVLNHRFCPDLYLGVVPVTEENGGLRMNGGGKAVEWAVQMRQLSQEDMLPARLKSDSVSNSQMQRIAKTVASFHRNAVTSAEIQQFGNPLNIRKNLNENFEQTANFINDTLTRTHWNMIQEYSERFLQKNQQLFLQRMESARIRDGHGDLRAQNICLDWQFQDGIQIFDSIEFNDRFRYEDVAADLAYLAMDLDLLGRADLRRILVDAYLYFSEDPELLSLLPFYRCYRAYVRGKIALFASVEKEIPKEQREEHETLAASAFDLAYSYSKQSSRPTLFIMTGVSGSGKSTVAEELARRLPAILLSSDKIRKELAGASPLKQLESDWYRPEQIARIYAELRNRAVFFLEQGEMVILDATFLSKKEREAAQSVATSCNASFRILECVCPENVARSRIKKRERSGNDPSDATVEVLQQQVQHYEHPSESTLTLNTEEPSTALARKVIQST